MCPHQRQIIVFLVNQIFVFSRFVLRVRTTCQKNDYLMRRHRPNWKPASLWSVSFVHTHFVYVRRGTKKNKYLKKTNICFFRKVAKKTNICSSKKTNIWQMFVFLRKKMIIWRWCGHTNSNKFIWWFFFLLAWEIAARLVFAWHNGV